MFNQPIKMVVCDLDGTLLYDSSKVTDRTKAAIQAIRKQGILFGVCSGRSAVALQTMLKVWGIDQECDFVLGFNGGMFFDPKTGQTSMQDLLPAHVIPQILADFQGYGFAFAEYEGKEMLATKFNPVTWRMAKRNRLDFKRVKKEKLVRDTLKFMAIGKPWKVTKFLESHAHSTELYRMFRSGPFLIEVINPRLSKLEGIKTAAKKYQIGLDEILTFGNDNNDLEMLEGCVGVAMDNALENVKEAASYITGSNKDDGVARFLEKHIIQNPEA